MSPTAPGRTQRLFPSRGSTVRSRSNTAAVLLTVLAVTIAACGGDDDAADATTPTVTPTATSAPTDATEPTEPSTSEPAGPVGTGSMDAADATSIDQTVMGLMGTPETNGATAFYLAISDPDRGDYTAAYGTTSIDGPAATTDDNVRIGSITKGFTATVVLQLVQEGELALDDTVADLMPDFAVDYPDLAPLTVEQLLGMTSGIADYLNVPDSVVAAIVDDPTRVWGAEELISAGIAAGVAPAGTPGYSTTNYIVLQLIAETLTGEPLQDLIAERITDPLGLDHLFLPSPDDTTLPEPATSGYIAGGCVQEFERDGATVAEGTDAREWSASYGQGGGGMTSNISDLLGWAETMTGNDLLDDDVVERRLALTDIGGLAYGLGILRVGAWFGHEGEAIGWEAFALHDPETGVSVALAANGCGGLIAPFAEILDAIYPDGAAFDALFYGPDPSWLTAPDAGETDTSSGSTEGGDSEEGSNAGSSEDPEVPSLGADGTATFTAGDISISGDVTSCLLDGDDVTMTVNGENAGIEVVPTGGGGVSVTVTGMAQWSGTGQATVDLGDVSITGTGSALEDGAAVDDFTLIAEIGAC